MLKLLFVFLYFECVFVKTFVCICAAIGCIFVKTFVFFVQETGCVFVKSFVETGCVFVKPFVFICAGNWVDWTGLEMPTIDFSVHCFKIVTIPILLHFVVKTIWRQTFPSWQHFLNWWFFSEVRQNSVKCFFARRCVSGNCCPISLHSNPVALSWAPLAPLLLTKCQTKIGLKLNWRELHWLNAGLQKPLKYAFYLFALCSWSLKYADAKTMAIIFQANQDLIV